MTHQKHLALIAILIAAQTLPSNAIDHPAAARSTEEAKTTSLPVRKVALYKNGIGFFEHSGTVNGNQQVTIDFTSRIPIAKLDLAAQVRIKF